MGTMCIDDKTGARVTLGITCTVCILLVAVGHGLGAIETHSREANEAVFATEFNRLYCSSRTMRVCLDGDAQSLLALVGRGTASDAVLRNSESVTDAAFATWRRCSQIFLGNTPEFPRDPEMPAGSYSIPTGVADKLLSKCVSSLEIDAWCGTSWASGTTELTPEANLAHPAPYASNTHLFSVFTSEWATRMKETDKLIGAAVGCLVFAMWCWRFNAKGTSYTQADGTTTLSTHRRVLGSLFLSAPVGVCVTLLPIAWLVIVPFYIDPDALHNKYDFKPMSNNSFVAWRDALAGLILLLTPVVLVLSLIAKCRTICGLFVVILIYSIQLIVGNALSSSRTNSRLANESKFAELFNKYYCDMRTLKICLDGSSRQDLVVLTRGSNATAGVFSIETPTSAILAIWKRCKTVISEAMAREAARDIKLKESRLKIKTKPIYQFLDDTNDSRATDTWCGDWLYRSTPLSTADHLALPSPYAANPAMFLSYTQEWPRRIYYSNIFLGTAIAGMVLVMSLHCVRLKNEQVRYR